MHCSFCKQGAPELTPHHLCNSCVDHMKCCNLNTKSNQSEETIASMEIILKAEPVQEVQCDACLGRFPEDDLPQHRTECMVRLVLRCGICNADYLGKGGLWNHLDTHEVRT
ncbi:hypothetical protein RP20_CCG014213 [Aedes albopictus]|nr:hypothetical protein RP20_CCG014213 [Aedes albopictus]